MLTWPSEFRWTESSLVVMLEIRFLTWLLMSLTRLAADLCNSPNFLPFHSFQMVYKEALKHIREETTLPCFSDDWYGAALYLPIDECTR